MEWGGGNKLMIEKTVDIFLQRQRESSLNDLVKRREEFKYLDHFNHLNDVGYGIWNERF